MVNHGGLSTVNCAACNAAPCVNESLKPHDFPVKFPVSRELQRESGLLETASTTKTSNLESIDCTDDLGK
jgi:hypothetical protein